MIRCNLALLLLERQISISKMATDTKISRTTLTSLASNHGQGVQFDTLNNICIYLDINLNQLFEYVPFNITTKPIDFDVNNLDISTKTIYILEVLLQISDKRTSFECPITAELNIIFNSNLTTNINLSFKLYDSENNDMKTKNTMLLKYLKNLSTSFFSDIKKSIIKNILIDLDSFISPLVNHYTLQDTWFNLDDYDINL